MKMCIELARLGGGYTNPNPRVGCVILSSDGNVLGKGWHKEYGGDHAEVNAIRSAIAGHGAEAVSSGTLVVNLEPCNHHGKTPPCSHLIVETGIKKVIFGSHDPGAKSSGGGTYLKEIGVEVIGGVEHEACFRFNEGFLRRATSGRPMVTLKMAQTLDGFVATKSGESKWITSVESRKRVHEMRSFADIVLTGRGTAEVDNPSLTVRLVEGKQPVRAVIDSKGQLSPSLNLFSDDSASRTIAITGRNSNPSYAQDLQSAGGRVWQFEANPHVELADLVDRLGREGGLGGNHANEIFVEAGPSLASSLIAADLVDRLYLFTAPTIMGQGLGTFGSFSADRIQELYAFDQNTVQKIGDDTLFTGYRRSAI